MSDKNDYKMPAVTPGTMVRWHPSGKASDETLPAIVSKVGSRAIAVNVVLDNSGTFLLKDGVRHVSDPGMVATERRDDGGWSHTKEHDEYLVLRRQVAELLEKAAKVK